MAHEKLIEVAMDYLDKPAIAYCAERLLNGGPWNEDSDADSTAKTLRLHLRTIPAARATLDKEESE